MVHALSEIHRVLRPEGRMADLRPLSEDVRVALAGPDGVRPIGIIDESEFMSLDLDSEAQMEAAVSRGWFRREGHTRFDFHWHFDTLDEFVEYVTEQWEDRLDDAVLSRAAEGLAASPPGTGIRVRKILQLGLYSRR